MQFHRASGLGRWAGTFLILLALAPEARAEEEAVLGGVPAVVLKVEGDGNARVRKRMGTEEIAGAGGQILEGDRIITDDKSAVHIMLNDGTVVKIGFNSEFLLQKAEPKEKYISWVFKLLQGSIRALVEKIPEQETHLRVETPSGTVGVRGTEFVLVHDPSEQGSHVYMLDGVVAYGAVGCDRAKGCLDVTKGQASFVGAGKPITPPATYEVKDLFAGDAKSIANGNARLSLFRDARRIQGTFPVNSDPAALKKIVDDAREELADAQDRAVGRTREQREAMHAAIKDGTFYKTLAAADAYAEAHGTFHHQTNGGAENMVAQVVAAKFRLGQAVRAADAAGLFADKQANDKDDGDYSNRTFTRKKSVDFDLKDAAKELHEKLDGTSDDYRNTLEYTEAIDPANAHDLLEEDTGASGSKHVPRGSKDGRRGKEAPERAKDPGTCHSASCRLARVAHQLRTAAEGSAAVFANKGEANAVAAQQAARAESKKSSKGRTAVRTKYFQRMVPGETCFETKEACRMEPCSKNGKKCKPGEQTRVCAPRQVAIPCKTNK